MLSTSFVRRYLVGAAVTAMAATGMVASAAPAHAATCTSYNYSYGGYSSCVGNIQVLLNAFQPRLGGRYPQLAVDNDFGPATRSAVIAFQRYWGLQGDGIVGPRTWNIRCSPQMGPGPIWWYPYSTARASGCAI